MKNLKVFATGLFIVLTAVEPIWAQGSQEAGTSRASLEGERELGVRDLGLKLNPQLGVGSFEYSGAQGGSNQKMSGGLTIEAGSTPLRKMETGLLVLQTNGSSMLTIPMLAKIRLVTMKAQSWYAKFGFMPAFELGDKKETNNIDVLGSLGIGGRLAFTRKADLIIDATYNRGTIDALRANGSNFNQGFLVLAGMSFSI